MLTWPAPTGIVAFTVSDVPPAPTASLRERALRRTLRRLSGLIDRAVATSARFTRWRLILFLAGAAGTVAPYKLGWYQTGNIALAVFLGCFAVVAWHHNRLEQRLHRPKGFP